MRLMRLVVYLYLVFFVLLLVVLLLGSIPLSPLPSKPARLALVTGLLNGLRHERRCFMSFKRGVGVNADDKHKRKHVSPGHDRRKFTHHAEKMRVENTMGNPMRGGIRL